MIIGAYIQGYTAGHFEFKIMNPEELMLLPEKIGGYRIPMPWKLMILNHLGGYAAASLPKMPSKYF